MFSLSNRTLDAKKVSLRKAGKGQKPNAARARTEKEEILTLEKGKLVFEVVTQEHRHLCFGEVELSLDPTADREYLVFSECLTKTRKVTGKENLRKINSRL